MDKRITSPEKASKIERGRDISAPVKHITLDGVTYDLVFSNKCARITEDVYENIYGLDKGFSDIILDLSKEKYRAIMAFYYASLIAGGVKMAWEEFDAKFKLDSVQGIGEILMQGVADSLPHPDDAGDSQDPQ